MDTARFRIGSLFVLILASVLGCNKSDPQSAIGVPPAPSPDTIARVHWLGLHHLAYEAGAFNAMRLWDMPETAAVEKQTLDKLSSAPWRWLFGENQFTNTRSLLLRPLLDDVVQDECHLEVRHPANQPEEFVFAIQLDDSRAGLWETNLANVFQSLTGAWPIAAGNHSWTLRREQMPGLIELVRVGQWTLLGVAANENPLLHEVMDRIPHTAAPFGVLPGNGWLRAEVDLKRLAADLSVNIDHAADLPRLSLLIAGDGAHVTERGELTFPEPLQLQLDTLDHSRQPEQRSAEQLHGGSRVQTLAGLAQVLDRPADRSAARPTLPLEPGIVAAANVLLRPGTVGNRWQGRCRHGGKDAQQRVPTNLVTRLTDLLVRDGNPWLAGHGMGSIRGLQGSDGAIWLGLPMISPYLKSVPAGANRLIIGAMLANPGSQTNPPPALYYHPDFSEIFKNLQTETNLVYFDWELTGPRIESSLDIGQALRLGLGLRQLPLDSASLAWLYAVRYRLDDCTTRITLTQPNQLTFDRKSTLGLSGAELNLLADWLESPQFPRGLFSLQTH